MADRMRRAGRLVVVLGALAVALAAAAAGAFDRRIPYGYGYATPLLVPEGGYFAPSCYSDVRIFDTLKYGPSDICRLRMRYRPGRLECYQILDQVCGRYLANGEWLEGRNLLRAEVLPCPLGPPPPLCPRLGALGIPDSRFSYR